MRAMSATAFNGYEDLKLVEFPKPEASDRVLTFNRDYHAETPDGVQLAVLNVFSRHEDGIHHHWTSENTFKLGSTSPLDPVWPIFGVLDLIREGRGDAAAYPNLQY